MKKERSDTKISMGSQALRASAKLCDIILQKYIADILPETRQIHMKELNAITN